MACQKHKKDKIGFIIIKICLQSIHFQFARCNIKNGLLRNLQSFFLRVAAQLKILFLTYVNLMKSSKIKPQLNVFVFLSSNKDESSLNVIFFARPVRKNEFKIMLSCRSIFIFWIHFYIPQT